MRRSRDEILQAFRSATATLGVAPRFAKLTGIKPSAVQYYWPRHSDLAREAGATPSEWQQPLTDEVLFEDYAKVCLHLQKIPTSRELEIATRELKTRTHSIGNPNRPATQFRLAFRAWLEQSQDEQLRQILEYPGWVSRKSARSSRSERPLVPVPAFHLFLPASLQYLDVLARGERAPFDDPAATPSVLFERRVADAFACLGFEVHTL